METVVELKKRGTVTIPEAMRKALNIEEGSILSIDVKKIISPEREKKENDENDENEKKVD